MASDIQARVIIDAENRTKRGFQDAARDAQGFDRSVNNLGNTAKKVGAILASAFAVHKIIAFGRESVNAFLEAETAQIKLAQVLRTATGATEEQIKALYNQAEALERVGVVSGTTILQAQQTFATFDMTTESIQRLIPSFLNMVVAEKGVNATTDDMISYANALGNALMGNYAALSKRGFKLDEDTKALIENGTEAERVGAIMKVLDSTYAGMNETMRNTTEGGIKGAQFAFEKLKEEVGRFLAQGIGPLLNFLTPVIQKFTEWATILADLGAGGIVNNLNGRFQELMTAIDLQTGLVTLLKDSWQSVVDSFNNNLRPALEELWVALQPFQPFLEAMAQVFGFMLVVAIGAFIKGLEGLVLILTEVFTVAAKVYTFWANTMIPIFEGFQAVIEGVIKAVNSLIKAMERLNIVSNIKKGAGAAVKSLIPGFDNGGIVPGAIGSPQLIMAHGGETVLPTHKAGFSAGGGMVVNINYPMLLDDSAIYQVSKKIAQVIKDNVKM